MLLTDARRSLQRALPFGDGWLEPEQDFGKTVLNALAYCRGRLPLARRVRVEWQPLPVTAGVAKWEGFRIVLSSRLLTTEQRVWDTVLHEYAHLAVFEQRGLKAKPHGAEWKDAMAILGQPPEVTHDYECARVRRRRRYVCVCNVCNEEIRRMRPLKAGCAYRHVGCGGLIRMERVDL